MAENYEVKVSFGTTSPGRSLSPPDAAAEQSKREPDFMRELAQATQQKPKSA